MSELGLPARSEPPAGGTGTPMTGPRDYTPNPEVVERVAEACWQEAGNVLLPWSAQDEETVKGYWRDVARAAMSALAAGAAPPRREPPPEPITNLGEVGMKLVVEPSGEPPSEPSPDAIETAFRHLHPAITGSASSEYYEREMVVVRGMLRAAYAVDFPSGESPSREPMVNRVSALLAHNEVYPRSTENRIALAMDIVDAVLSGESPRDGRPSELALFFREEEHAWGLKGDYENWPTERAAIELIRHLRAEIAAWAEQSSAGDGRTFTMKEPLPEWGPAECEARKALNCVRYELAPDIAQDVIDRVLTAFAELRDGRTRTPTDGLLAQKDAAYRERDMCVALIAKLAAAQGYRVGMARHEGEWEDDWRWIVYIDLPTGQVSWHIHDSEREWFDFQVYPGTWDGHTTDQKYERMAALRAGAAPPE